MNRDVITTVGGLVVVGVVVVATFLYGNSQHQAQLRRDQTAQRQQSQQKQSTATATTPSPSPSATPSSSTPAQQPAVEKPSAANQTSLQGGSHSSSTTGQTAATTPTTPSSVPTTGGSQPAPQSIPATGSSVFYLIGATLMALGYHWYRRSRSALQQAVLRS